MGCRQARAAGCAPPLRGLRTAGRGREQLQACECRGMAPTTSSRSRMPAGSRAAARRTSRAPPARSWRGDRIARSASRRAAAISPAAWSFGELGAMVGGAGIARHGGFEEGAIDPIVRRRGHRSRRQGDGDDGEGGARQERAVARATEERGRGDAGQSEKAQQRTDTGSGRERAALLEGDDMEGGASGTQR